MAKSQQSKLLSKMKPKQPTFDVMAKPRHIEPPKERVNELWSTKWAPSLSTHLVGNHSLISNLKNWLVNWKHDMKPKYSPYHEKARFWNSTNSLAKACLLSGPPGIGKTSSVRLLAQELGFELIEQNASEQRNKTSISRLLNGLKGNNVINDKVGGGLRKVRLEF